MKKSIKRILGMMQKAPAIAIFLGVLIFGLGALSAAGIDKPNMEEKPVLVKPSVVSQIEGFPTPPPPEFISPVPQPRETSAFGLRPNPWSAKQETHFGIDLVSDQAGVVYVVAVRNGTVITHWPAPDGYFSGHWLFGGYLEILHDNGISSYAHMSRVFPGEGDFVLQGQKIGIMGDTGITRGIHLHFEWRGNPRTLFDVD